VFLLALVIILKSPKNLISVFYSVCVLLLVSFGVLNFYSVGLKDAKLNTYLFAAIVFLYSLFPFLFLHFVIVFVGFAEILKSKRLLFTIYFAALFSYTLILLGWIPLTGLSKGIYSFNLSIFYLIWLSIFFGLGIVHLYSLFGGYVDKGKKSNLILTGFTLLLFILPGPFSESLLQVIIGQKVEVYFFSSTLALIFSVYLVFRHKSVVTLTDTLKSVIEVINDVVIKTDEKFRIDLAKGRTLSLLGYSEKEIIGKNFNDLINNKSVFSSAITELIDSAVTGNHYDFEIKNKSGEIVKMNFSISAFWENNMVSGFAFIGREVRKQSETDITYQTAYEELEKLVQEKTAALSNANNELILENMERRRVEKALFESQERFRKSFEDAPISMALLSIDGFFLRVNRAFAELLKYPENELLKKRYIDLTYEVDKQKSESFLIKILNGECNSFKLEKRFVKSNGTAVWTSVSSSIIKDEIELKPIYFIIQIQDITERKKAEEELNKYSEELKELNASKDKFFSILAHDLKAPFQGLLGYAKILNEEISKLDQEEIISFAANIHQLSENVYGLITNLLEWSRLQTNRIEISFTKLNLYHKINEVFNLLESNAQNKNIILANEVETDIYIKTDEKIVSSIIQNFVSNGIKFTNPGGRITIKSDIDTGFVKIFVIDDGIGISPENKSKLFRIDSSFTTEGTMGEIGTGLGLILCKEFSEILGGDISVQSELGKGTTFIVSLPLAAD